MFGGKSDYVVSTLTATTNDLEALRAAVSGSAALGLECVVRGKTFIDPVLKTEPIYLDSYARIRTEGGGAIVHDGAANGVPWFWSRGEAFFSFDCDLLFAGTLDPSDVGYVTQPEFTAFVTDILLPTRTNAGATAVWGQDNCTAALLILGGHDMTINMRCRSLVDTGAELDVLRYKKIWLYVTNGDDGVKPYNIDSDVLAFDGMIFGVLCSAVGRWRIKKLIGGRYGEPGWYTALGHATEPAHLFYATDHPTVASTNTTSDVIIIDEAIDDGPMITSYNNGANSLKCKSVQNFTVNGGYSRRPSGGIEGWSPNWQVHNFFTELDWSVIMSGDAQIRPLRLLSNVGLVNPNGGEWANCKWKIKNGAHANVTATPVMFEAGGGCARLRFQATVEIDTLDPAFAGWLMLLAGVDNDIDITIIVATPNASNGAGGGITLCRIDSNGSGNRLKFKTRGLTSIAPYPRIVENSKPGSVNNWAEFEKLDDGFRRSYSPGGQAIDRVTKVVTAAALTGANVSLASIIPAGAQVVAISSLIVTALGATLGCTGYTLGLVGNTACYGTRAALTIGSGTSGANWTSGAPADRVTIATSLLITATGGLFDGAGAIDVSVEYVLAQNELNFYDA
jgi:hypothetical protein